MATPSTSNFSLWLVPDTPEGPVLRELVYDLAGRHATMTFAPHVTLVGALTSVSEEDAIAHAASLAESVSPLRLPFTHAEAGADKAHWQFRCVYARVADNEALTGLYSRALSAFALPADTPFMPHLSLMYSDCDEGARAAVCEEVAGLVAEVGGITVTRLQVWDTSAPRSDAWQLLEEFPLGVAAAAAATE